MDVIVGSLENFTYFFLNSFAQDMEENRGQGCG
jgi:hypothetical protein